jgi:hypothetical protein
MKGRNDNLIALTIKNENEKKPAQIESVLSSLVSETQEDIQKKAELNDDLSAPKVIKPRMKLNRESCRIPAGRYRQRVISDLAFLKQLKNLSQPHLLRKIDEKIPVAYVD